MRRGKVLLFVGGGCAVLLAALVVVAGTFFVKLSLGPDTFIYSGSQVPKRYVETVRSLGMLDDDESIRYFYSDALFDIEEGFYLVTDRHLILYSSSWEEPETVIPLGDIESVSAVYDDSIFVDSWVDVATVDGLEVSFPLSSERGLDKKFVALLEAGGGGTPPTEIEASN